MREREYSYSVSWSDEDQLFIGRVLEFRSLIAHGKTAPSALREIMKVVRDTIEELDEQGESIPEPFSKKVFSGRFVVRIASSLHRELAIEADRQGVSLNQLIAIRLSGV